MTDASRAGPYTGPYSVFSTLPGPSINGRVVEPTGRNYNNVMVTAPLFRVAARVLMPGVKRGEAIRPGVAAAARD